jgi:apolipoprotein D and lipocalin family protein
MIYKLLLMLTFFSFFSCSRTSIPDGAKAVSPFDKDKYLGKWYEIARFDFSFEKNLNNTTANYSLNSNGTIRVENRGYNYKTGKWQKAVGKAKFVSNTNTAMLKVSFFGPFYGGYNVIALDKDYKYALVAGDNLDYLWILSRETSIPEAIKTEYLNIAKSVGYDLSRLIWVEHEKTKS